MKKAALLLIPILYSCVSSTEVEDITTDTNIFSGDVVPDQFTWSLSEEWSFSVDYSAIGTSVIGKQVLFLDSTGNRSYETRVTSLQESYDFKTSTSRNKLTLFIPALGVSHPLSAEESSVSVSKASNSRQASTTQSANCACEKSAATTGTITVQNGETVCIQDGFAGSLFFSGAGTVNICSNATLFNIYGNAAGIIRIAEGASVTVSNWNNNYNEDAIHNYGTLAFSGFANINKGSLLNYGTLTINGGLNDNQGVFENYGTTEINGNCTFSHKYTINDGQFIVRGQFILNTSAELVSGCSIYAYSGFTLNGKLELAGSTFTDIRGTFIMNSSGKLFFNGANTYVKAEKMILNGNIRNYALKNLLSVPGSLTVNSSGSISAEPYVLGLCSPNYSFEDKKLEVEAGCEYSIPVSDCNPSGLNLAKDSDGDGCTDDEDEFPYDPAKCYSVSEPANGYKLIAFEDLWPHKGDYDFNDLVIKFRTIYVKNAANELVQARHTFIIESIGASFNNAFAIHYLHKEANQYNVENNAIISSIETNSNYMTLKQAANTVVVSESVFKSISSYYQNNGSGPSKAPDTLHLTTNFYPGKTSNVCADIYLFRATDPGLEIHLPDLPPTPQADRDYFGTSDDASDLSRTWYKTENNLPWAMEIYLEDDEEYFVPVEKTVITEAYPDFASWAGSGGQQNKNWNKNYRSDKVFKY